jgi:Leucine-rich repeat (LRR) protein
LEESIDPDIKLPLVSVINLSGNRITSIPAGIFNKLSNLSKLYLSGNRIEKMSFPYFSENKLRVIDISNNCLKSLNL